MSLADDAEHIAELIRKRTRYNVCAIIQSPGHTIAIRPIDVDDTMRSCEISRDEACLRLARWVQQQIREGEV